MFWNIPPKECTSSILDGTYSRNTNSFGNVPLAVVQHPLMMGGFRNQLFCGIAIVIAARKDADPSELGILN